VSCKLQIANYKLRVANYEIGITGYELEFTISNNIDVLQELREP
jgi:hypothetical protein